jgi:4-diphosphocytidyl-2-C-methyl-D-erythritol kinase
VDLRAPAKINLSLIVAGKRPDGYHEISSVMQAAGLFDEVSVGVAVKSAGDVPSIRLSTDRTDLPTGSGNTAYRAAKAVLETFGFSASIDIHIKKRIPVAAGLGGGSADAAAAMLGVSHALGILDGRMARGSARDPGTDISDTWEKLLAAGLRVGADVPFCLHTCAALNDNLGLADNLASTSGGQIFTAALAEGKGELLTGLCPQAGAGVVIAELPFAVSTQSVYAGVTEYGDAATSVRLAEALAKGDLAGIAAGMQNDLQTVASSMHPGIAEAAEHLSRACPGATRVMMSGSGPTLFAYYPNFSEIKSAADVRQRISKLLEGCGIARLHFAELY